MLRAGGDLSGPERQDPAHGEGHTPHRPPAEGMYVCMYVCMNVRISLFYSILKTYSLSEYTIFLYTYIRTYTHIQVYILSNLMDLRSFTIQT